MGASFGAVQLSAEPLGGGDDLLQFGKPRTYASLVGLIALLSCSTPQIHEDLPSSFYPEGDYQHVITGLTFPRAVGRYRRIHVSRYDAEFHNVGGHYELAGPPWGIATVYHYPAATDGSFPTYADLVSEFELAKRDLVLVHEGATLISESKDDALINGASLKGLQAVYLIDHPENTEGPIVSSLHLYSLENWYLKFRLSHAEVESPHVISHERDFIEAIEWPIPGGKPPKSYPEECISLANSYELVARNKDLGLTEEEQLELLGDPGESKEDRYAHAIMVNAVSVAVAFPDKTSLQIRNLVLDDCTEDEDGRVHLNKFWPWTQ